MRKKAILTLIAVLVLIGLFFYLYPLRDGAKNNPYVGTVTIGVVPFPGYSAFYVARDKEFFKEVGLDVKIKSYNTLAEQTSGYNKKEAQLVAYNVADAVSVLFGGVDSKIVAIIDYSTGVDAIISDYSIKNASDVKGRRVAYEKGTLEEFLLASVLGKYTLSVDDVVSINASPEEAVKKLIAGEVDAAVTYEPYLSGALKDSRFHTIYSTKEDPSMISDVLMSSEKFVNDNPEVIRKILIAYFKARTYMDTNPDESRAIIAKELGIEANEIENQLKGVSIRTLAENKKAFESGESDASYYLRLDAVGKFLARIKNISNRINTDTLIDPSFVRSLDQ